MARRFFITGTDTNVGKTLVTCVLLKALQAHGFKVMALKPVASGCEQIDGGLKNEDALAMIEAMNHPVSYQSVNPFAFQPAIAPHIAAADEGVDLSVLSLTRRCSMAQDDIDYWLVEGAGGWLVPLNDQETFADYVASQAFEVILVVGLKLGCINHALLTKQSIESAGLTLAGWVANQVDPEMVAVEENLASLTSRLGCPMLGHIPFLLDPQEQTSLVNCLRAEDLIDQSIGKGSKIR